MDFPVCPACHQSVIDDDAVDCPFCGASMKGKPTAKPAAKAAAIAPKPETTASKPVVTKPVQGKSTPGKPTLPGDDFPFEAELTTGKSAIQAMPNPTKQRTLKVVCPMCDTPGYLPPTAAGQEIRCANAKCVMPVFTAPSEKKKEPEPAPPPLPRANRMPLIAAATVLVMAVVGGGLYFYSTLPGNAVKGPKTMSDEDKALLAEMSGKGVKPANAGKTGGKAADQTNGEKNPNVVPQTSEPTAEVRIQDALKLMQNFSLEKSKQRSKPYCRQLSAEASAIAGDVKSANEHLGQLLKVGNQVSYYQITPLLELFWRESAAGDKKAAASRLDAAMKEVSKIPKFGRTRLDIAGRLATALVASGRVPDAKALLKEIHSSDEEGQLAAKLQIATDGHVAPLQESYSLLPGQFPQAVATTVSLMTRGQMEAAANWAAAQDDDEAKTECLAAWAEAVSRQNAKQGATDVDGAIAAALKSLSPALAARVWARAGCGRIAAQDHAGAAAAVKLVQESMAAVPVPQPVAMPNLKATLRFKLPSAVPMVQAAIAMGELAHLQSLSPESKADAEKSLELAFAFADGMAPFTAIARKTYDEAERRGPVGLRSFLKTELKIKSDDEARTVASNYKTILHDIVEASNERFELQTKLLQGLLRSGLDLNHKIWIMVNARATSDDLNRRDDYFATSIPGELIERMKGTVEEKAIRGAWSLHAKGDAPPRPVSAELNDKLQANPGTAVKYLSSAMPKSAAKDELMLLTVSRLAEKDQLPVAFKFIADLDDIVNREECYRLAAAIGALRGQVAPVVSQIAAVVEHTEKVSLCRGLVAGLIDH
ncbi:hypothetical protein [Schlesneria paludicola]|uniref:hypothetical protein n=1 Tax=Schlesneria paludicola TaxID=360056 RepID=UPI00029B331D|nr:hypothetical protein [Schlesneria paludicola]